ncbi:MAG: hypothetical protein KKE71_01305 [Nanoarchaeota archaeon]|nr:hypothetical protein [Nanoarchaeota archaeon]
MTGKDLNGGGNSVPLDTKMGDLFRGDIFLSDDANGLVGYSPEFREVTVKCVEKHNNGSIKYTLSAGRNFCGIDNLEIIDDAVKLDILTKNNMIGEEKEKLRNAWKNFLEKYIIE